MVMGPDAARAKINSTILTASDEGFKEQGFQDKGFQDNGHQVDKLSQ